MKVIKLTAEEYCEETRTLREPALQAVYTFSTLAFIKFQITQP